MRIDSSNSHSHDIVKLFSIENKYKVKKTFVTDRLRVDLNLKKQTEFNGSNYVNLYSVPIESITEDAESKSIVMPYINGINAEGAAIHYTREITQSFIDTFSQYIEFNISKSFKCYADKSVFIKKIGPILDSKIIKRNDLDRKTKNWFDKNLSYPLEYYSGYCHGDLTLGNVLFDKNRFYLIDFLETFLESPLQDIAKLYQEFKYGWSIRYSDIHVQTKGFILYEYILTAMNRRLSKLVDKSTVEVFELVSLLRIVPYIHDEVTEQWVSNSINKFLDGF